MRKALLITIVFLLLTLSITQSAIAQRQNIITNQTTEPLYVVYSTKFGAHDAIPAGYWTAGWREIQAGQQEAFWAYDPHKIYFQIWKGSQRVKPLSSTQTLAFWINRNADFNVVTQQEINASITRGQLVYSSHDTSALTHSDGFMRYNNGSRITVTNAWVDVPDVPADDAMADDGEAEDDGDAEISDGAEDGGDDGPFDGAAAIVSIDPPQVAPPVGSQLTIHLKITNAQNVLGYQATVNFDPSELRYISSAYADYPSAGAFFIPTRISEGKVLFVATGTEVGAASGTLGTVTFAVVASKKPTIWLTGVELAGGDGEALAVTTRGGSPQGERPFLSEDDDSATVPLVTEEDSEDVQAAVATDAPVVGPNTAINIPDPNLRIAIEKKLGKSPGAVITVSDMDTSLLSELKVVGKNIQDLTGLEFATHLTVLHLWGNQISDISPLAKIPLVELSIFKNQISDISPLAELINLVNLFIYDNQISDISPLAALTNLRNLWIYGNQISDISPLAALTNLLGLSISDNQISDISPLTALTNLRNLGLYGNQISDISPLTAFTNLRWLRLSTNQISDISPLAALTNLEWLELDENQISDISPLAALTNLNNLELDSNQISDISPLTALTNLRELRLDENQISDISPLAGLTNLTVLYLDNNAISDVSPLAGLTNLTQLDLRRNEISDVSPLAQLKNLKGLYLSDNQILDVSPLAGLKNLTTLNLNSNKIPDFSPIAGLIPNLTRYSNTNQRGLVNIPDPKLRFAIEKALGKTSGATITPADMLKLTELSPVALGIQLLDGKRWGVKDLTGLGFAANLTELDLRSNEISDVSPLAGLKNLETLFFAGNEISDISPLAGLKNLKTLMIGNRIADVSPLAGLKNLERLLLYKNRISDISPLAELKNLKRLNLSSNKISDVSPLAGLKNLERLDLRRNLIVDFSPIAGLISNLTEYVDKPQDIADENYWSFYTIYWPDPMYSIADLDWATDTYVICGGADTDGSGFLRNFNIHQGVIQYLTYKNDLIISVAIPQHDPSYVVYGRLSQDYASMRYIDDFSWRGRFGQDTMTAIEFANVPDAPHYLLTGGSNSWVNTWDTENPQDIIHGEHWKTGGGIRALDPNALLIADGDNNVDDWDFSFGKIRAREEARQIDGFLEGIAHGFGELFAPEEKRNVVIKAVYDVHTEPVTSLSQLRYSYGNSSWFVSGSEDNTIRTWDKFNNKSISVGTAHKADVNSVDISPNGNFIASGSNDNTVCIWKCSDGDITELNSQFFADTDVLVVKFSPNGDYLAVGTKSGLYIYKNGRAVTPAPALTTTSPEQTAPEQTALLHNYPNPFNPETWIPYHLSEPAEVTLTIYGIDGRVVRRLDLGHQDAGYYQSKSRAAYWDGRNNVGERVASGIYFYTLTVGDFSATQKLLIRK